jgi:REP element-mobilizing transposase RayT/DNA-binding response OmpR family regulator
MKKTVLVVTPNKGFGELICQILDETGAYDLSLATSGQHAMDSANANNPAICILEPGLQDYMLDRLIESLILNHPGMKLVLIAPESVQSNIKLIEQISVDGILFKPFYLQDIVIKVEKIMGGVGTVMVDNTKPNKIQDSKTEVTFVELPETNWHDDSDFAIHQLKFYSNKTDALVSLITKKEKLWAYEGSLKKEAVNEISNLLAEYFLKDGGSDLARFVELQSTGANLMLYTTTLMDDYMLVLGFDAQIPFSKIRKQAAQISKGILSGTNTLIEGDSETGNSEILGKVDQIAEIDIDSTLVMELEKTTPSSSNDNILDESESPIFIAMDLEEPTDEQETTREVFVVQDIEEAEQESSDATFAISIDEEISSESKDYSMDLSLDDNDDVLVSTEPQRAKPPLTATLDPMVREENSFSSMVEDIPTPMSMAELLEEEDFGKKRSFLDELIDDIESGEELDIYQETEATIKLPASRENMAKTIPSKIYDETINLESVSSSLYSLNYACTLLPKLPHTKLTGEIKKQLLKWVSEICLAFDWRVESLSIYPEYMQWNVNVTPDNSPEIIINTIREYTSDRIFSQFPRYQRLNPSEKFWATGYLLIGDKKMAPKSIINQFITNTRNRQGVGNIKNN